MIKGSIVALTTPSGAQGAIDYEALEALVDWHVQQGSAALLVGSETDASLTLDVEERTELFRRTVWQAEGRIAVIADISGSTTEEALEYAGGAREAGPDAVLLKAPATSLVGQLLLQHFASVAKAAQRPLIVRDGPQHPALAAAIVESLARIDGVVGFAEATADLNRARELLALQLPADFALYAGDDTAACTFILEGFAGGISVTANLAPAQVTAVYGAALARDRSTAESLNARLQPLQQALLADPNSIAVKWALVEMGLVNEGARPPTLQQSSDYSVLRRALRTAQIAI